MKFKEFKKPEICGNEGNMQFVLFDGSKTKLFFSVAEFDQTNAVYPILNKDNEVIEYMDLVGNFTQKPTMFAKKFAEYINSRRKGICYGSVECYVYFTSLLDFPSKYLMSKKVRKIVKSEELSKYKNACKNQQFTSLLDRLAYKLYVLDVYYKKVERAKRELKNIEKENAEDLYFKI